MVIECKNITKIYNAGGEDFTALNNISFSVARGEFVSVMGPSGCGKSTLLNILGLLDEPSCGDYLLDGRSTAKLKDKQHSLIRRKTIGFIFQSFNLLPRLDVFDNVALPMRYAGVSEEFINKRVMELLERVGLAGKAKNTPLQLSGGQMQRVACARSLVNGPSLLLADEPTGNLDSKVGHEIMNLLLSLNSEGLTIVMVTHDRGLADKTKRIIMLKDGEII